MARERPDSTRSRPMTDEEAALMDANKRLAWWVANRMLRRVAARRGNAVDSQTLFEDLLDAALFGLSLAAKTFRPELGAFSTYAVTVMSGECARLLERSGRKLPPPDIHVVSLSDLIAHEDSDGDALGDLISDPGAEDPADAATRRALPAVLRAAIDKLPEREAEVIRRRFLLGQNLEKIGSALGRSRQRIYQIERQALERLRGILQQGGYAAAADLI
ncbi:MAG: sigma-70 family RNA polymerase sigma factor [Armatimonadetes bacterium]|nr:sigma-70 family RNA polymerase sigma factor [Armatimonadota bacterium]